MTGHPDDAIRARARPECRLCGARGEPLYQRLRDRLFNAPGEWDLKRCPNPRCGLVWLDPMPITADLGKAYSSYFTHRDELSPPRNMLRRAYRRARAGYLARRYGYQVNGVTAFDRLLGLLLYLHPGRRADADASVFYLNPQPDARLLEFGCGSGAALKRMSELGWEVEGVDFDPRAVQNARSKGLSVRIGDLAEQRYPANSFDAIAMSHVIEHVPDPVGLLRECQRILRTGGRLVIITPNVASWVHRLFGSSYLALDPPRHLHLFNPNSLASLVTRTGFEAIDCRPTGRARGVLLLSRSIRRTGRADLPAPYPLAWRVWAEGMELVEWALNLLTRQTGEELVLMASKAGGPQCDRSQAPAQVPDSGRRNSALEKTTNP